MEARNAPGKWESAPGNHFLVISTTQIYAAVLLTLKRAPIVVSHSKYNWVGQLVDEVDCEARSSGQNLKFIDFALGKSAQKEALKTFKNCFHFLRTTLFKYLIFGTCKVYLLKFTADPVWGYEKN